MKQDVGRCLQKLHINLEYNKPSSSHFLDSANSSKAKSSVRVKEKEEDCCKLLRQCGNITENNWRRGARKPSLIQSERNDFGSERVGLENFNVVNFPWRAVRGADLWGLHHLRLSSAAAGKGGGG